MGPRAIWQISNAIQADRNWPVKKRARVFAALLGGCRFYGYCFVIGLIEKEQAKGQQKRKGYFAEGTTHVDTFKFSVNEIRATLHVLWKFVKRRVSVGTNQEAHAKTQRGKDAKSFFLSFFCQKLFALIKGCSVLS